MKKTPNQNFCEWLDRIPYGEYAERRKELADYCGVSVQVVIFWRCGRTSIKPAYKMLIEQFAGQKIFNQ
jgi:hypothetical protein